MLKLQAKTVAPLAGMLLCFLSFGAGTDLIEYRSGRLVEGQVLDTFDRVYDDGRRELMYKVRIGESTLEIPASAIKSIQKNMTLRKLYREKWVTVDPGNVSQRLELAKWCLRHRLMEEAKREYEHILTLDPDNRTARRYLGYVRLKGKWVPEAEARRAQGLVLYRGRWVTPRQKEREQARYQRMKISRKVRAIFRRMRSHPEEREELLEKLLKIDSPHLVSMLVEYADRKEEKSPVLRCAAAAALGRLKAKKGVEVLGRAALFDPDSSVRKQAAISLGEIRDDRALRIIIPYLAHRERYLRARSARALGYIKNLKSVPALIEGISLKIVVNYVMDPERRSSDLLPMLRAETLRGGKTITTINPVLQQYKSLALLGLSVDKPQKKVSYVRNDIAYETLKNLTGQNFGFDKPKWRAWWAAHQDDLLADE